MEMQQIIEILAQMKPDRKADQARMEANQEDLLTRLEARIKTNMEKDREDLKGMMKEINAKIDTKR
jgi:hypothetical protein